MNLKQRIWITLTFSVILDIAKAILLLSVPFVLATSSIWMKWLITVLPSEISKWVTDSFDGLNSLFSVLAGAYLTLYATYTMKKKEERQKNIASKELAFYSPMFHEIVEALNYREKEKIWGFVFEDNSYSRAIKWTFWYEAQTTLLKYSIPKIFSDKLTELDTNIKNYMSTYDRVSLFCIETATEMNKQAGLIDNHFKGAYYNILEEIYLGTFSQKSVKDSVPNCKNINIDCEKLSHEISKRICDSTEYINFLKCSQKVDELINEVYQGLDYILMRIHSKYRGMNTMI